MFKRKNNQSTEKEREETQLFCMNDASIYSHCASASDSEYIYSVAYLHVSRRCMTSTKPLSVEHARLIFDLKDKSRDKKTPRVHITPTHSASEVTLLGICLGGIVVRRADVTVCLIPAPAQLILILFRYLV